MSFFKATFYTPNNPMVERTSSSALSPARQHSSDHYKRIIGVLGGEIDRKTPGLAGRVLEQRKTNRPDEETNDLNSKATAIAYQLAHEKKRSNTVFKLSNPRFLAASFSTGQRREKFLDALKWMLESGVEVIVTLEHWMEELMIVSSAVCQKVKHHLPEDLIGEGSIWMIRNPLNTSLNGQLLYSIAEQSQCSQKNNQPR